MSMLKLSAKEAMTKVIDVYLKAAHQNALWLHDRRRTHSLHDFRVALRRLRCWLRVLQTKDSEGPSRSLLKEVAKLARSTNTARDIEVQLDLIKTIKATWLSELWQRRVSESRQVAQANFGEPYLVIEKKIRLALAANTTDRADVLCFGDVFLSLKKRAERRLQKRLKKITSINDRDEMHRARIAAKNLRYLLEPLTGEMPNLNAYVENLKRLQDLLGSLHDLHMLQREVKKMTKDADTKSNRARYERLLKDISQREKEQFKGFHESNYRDTASLSKTIEEKRL